MGKGERPLYKIAQQALLLARGLNLISKERKYLLLAALLALSTGLLFAFINEFVVLATRYEVYNYKLYEYKYILWRASPSHTSLLFIVSALFGLGMAMNIYGLRKGIFSIRSTGSGLGGSASGFLATTSNVAIAVMKCPCHYSYLVSLLGLGSVILLAQYMVEFFVMSALLLLASLYWTARALDRACRVRQDGVSVSIKR